MLTLHLDARELNLGFEQGLRLANAAAHDLLYYDYDRNLKSPAGVSLMLMTFCRLCG